MANPNSSIPATSFPSHKLSSGLYVSGRPDQYKEKAPTMSSAAMPYTGGDIKKSGELGKMFDIQVEAAKSKKSGQLPTSASRSGTLGGIGSNSGPLSSAGAPRSAPSASGHMSSTGTQRQSNTSGPQLSNARSLSGSGSAARHGSKSGLPESGAVSKASVTLPAYTPNPSKHSGPLAANLPATGLITSGPISSGPLSTSTSRKYSGPIDSAGAGKLASGPTGNNQAINNLSHDKEYSFRKNFPKRAVIGFANGYRDAELGTAKDGQYVKVTGVVTCGSVSLESSFQNVNRCIYTSTSLYEYRGFNSLQANDKHRRFTWGLRHLERHIVDFYISDFQSGLRALVKAGYGATVSPYVEESIVLKLPKAPSDVPADFLHWLTQRNLSRDDRTMRLSEGFIKEGSTVTVLGVVQRHDNVLMIIPPPEPVSTGCQWTRFLLPATIDGIIIKGENTFIKVDVA